MNMKTNPEKPASVRLALFALGADDPAPKNLPEQAEAQSRPLEKLASLSPFGTYADQTPGPPGRFDVIEQPGVRKIQDLASVMGAAFKEKPDSGTNPVVPEPPPARVAEAAPSKFFSKKPSSLDSPPLQNIPKESIEAEVFFELEEQNMDAIAEPVEDDSVEDFVVGWAEMPPSPSSPAKAPLQIGFAPYTDEDLWKLYLRYAEELRRAGRLLSVPGFASFCSRLQAIETHFFAMHQTDQFVFELVVKEGRPYIIAKSSDSSGL